jgi:uncharacterized ion transporter superfamily protein YfcC
MDVSNSENVSEEADISSVPSVKTQKSEKFADQTRESQNTQTKMRTYITIFVLGLLLIIVIYGLIMQNYWLVGIGCFPLIRRGVNKIFDRYL